MQRRGDETVEFFHIFKLSVAACISHAPLMHAFNLYHHKKKPHYNILCASPTVVHLIVHHPVMYSVVYLLSSMISKHKLLQANH